MFNREDILKDTPDYENYSENEVKLTVDELRELGMLRCGGCCKSKGGNASKCNGCNKSEKCCKSV